MLDAPNMYWFLTENAKLLDDALKQTEKKEDHKQFVPTDNNEEAPPDV